MKPTLNFNETTPVALEGLGGLVRDHFCNGRLFATVSQHGGLLDVGYWGRQHMGAIHFFHGTPQSPWAKLLRVYAGVGEHRYHLTLKETHLYPFGYSSSSEVGGVKLKHDLLLLPDALVHRFKVTDNPQQLPVRIETLHQEEISANAQNNRTWSDMEFIPEMNALITSCTDLNPGGPISRDDGFLAQRGNPLVTEDCPEATTWIGIGCDSTLHYHRGYHRRSKHYLKGSPIKEKHAAIYLVFAYSREELEARLAGLSKTVHAECDTLLNGYAERLSLRPWIETGNKVLNSAFMQYPECVHHTKVPDESGAVRSTNVGYWVWGWDGLNVPYACTLANEPEYAAEILRFYHRQLNDQIGIPISFTGTFAARLQTSFPAQLEFIAMLYHTVAMTGDVALAKELMPTCRFLIDRCRERKVQETGLVKGCAMWPDFPEAMEETGNDVSSMNNSIMYQGLRSMEFLAAALGENQLAAECREWAATLRASFVKYLFDQEKGFFISSCDSETLKPRKHYCTQSIFWMTSFARELITHAPQRIADFMNKELRTDKCLLTLPHWDTAWMADGNQLGSSFPPGDHFYLNAQKLVGNVSGLKQWQGDVEWFWTFHTAPEAFTPESENEAEIGVDNPGGKQTFAVTTWYVGAYTGLGGLDFDHEGITFTPWGDAPLSIRGLRLHGTSIDFVLSGSGTQVETLKLNGKLLSAGTRKILWSQLNGEVARIELVRTDEVSSIPVIIRADGLRVEIDESGTGTLRARIDGTIFGEVVLQAAESARIKTDGLDFGARWDPATGTFTIPFNPGQPMILEVSI